MSITVLNYMDQALVDRIHSQAAKRAETAKQTTSDDFATVLADSTKAIENNQNTISTNTAVSDTSTVSTGQTAASSASSYTSNELDSIFEDAANTYGVSSIILKSIAKAESGFNPSAVSSAGAVGIMQLMPSTAAALGVSNSYDARENIMGGAKYISQLLSNYQGNISLALAAYNAGSANVDKYGGIPPFTETQNYVKKVLSYMEEFGSAVSNTVSSVSDQLSSIFSLTGTARDEANQMLADFFSSKNISKDALDILTAILKLKNMISGQTTSTDVSSALQNTDTTSSAAVSSSVTPSDRTAVLTSINSDSETIEDITKGIPVRVIPSAETDTDEDTDTETNTDIDAAVSTDTNDDVSTDTDSESYTSCCLRIARRQFLCRSYGSQNFCLIRNCFILSYIVMIILQSVPLSSD